MKKLFLYLPFAILFASCIQKEALNSEADIETCKVLNAAGQVDVHVKGNPIISKEMIVVQANPHINIKALALDVILTVGATITPNPREVRDYSTSQSFVVTSQDGMWKQNYKVSVDTFDLPTKYNFEHFELSGNGKYYNFYEIVVINDTTIRTQYIWASGNSGFALTGTATSPEGYPTVPKEQEAKLQTLSTGPFGEMVNMPIAAGNLFIGSFDVLNATTKPLQATLFGLPFTKKPVAFSGRYKYQPGADFTAKDANGKKIIIPEQKDSCDIYAVLYESEGTSLNGDNVLTSPKIVAMARLENAKAGSEYVNFDIPFDYKGEREVYWPSFVGNVSRERVLYRKFSKDKAESYQYNLAVVFTSSKYGAFFAGAVGSVLYVDGVQIVCE